MESAGIEKVCWVKAMEKLLQRSSLIDRRVGEVLCL